MSIVKETSLGLYENYQKQFDINFNELKYERLVTSLENFSTTLEKLIIITCNIENTSKIGFK